MDGCQERWRLVVIYKTRDVLRNNTSTPPHPHPTDAGCSWTPRRPSSCWSTSTAWCRCPRPSLRSTSRSETRTASSTWSTPRRRPLAAREWGGGSGRESGTSSGAGRTGGGQRGREGRQNRPETTKLHNPLHVAAPSQSVSVRVTPPLSLSS